MELHSHLWTYYVLSFRKEETDMTVMLNQILDEKGISQNKLSKDTGISISTLRNLNHNRTTRISFEILEKICLYLDCGVEDILHIETSWSIYDHRHSYSNSLNTFPIFRFSIRSITPHLCAISKSGGKQCMLHMLIGLITDKDKIFELTYIEKHFLHPL